MSEETNENTVSTDEARRRTPPFISMWRNSRMVMLAAFSAGIYIAVLLPFKGIQVIPGFAEVRVGSALPVVLGVLFGPAGAWGAGIGNLVADFFGTLSLGSFFGFWGNILFGYVGFKLWGFLPLASGDPPSLPSVRSVVKMIVLIVLAVMCKGAFIGYGVDVLQLVPYVALAGTIAFTNGLPALILAPILLKLLYGRVERIGLLWTDVMSEELEGRPLAPRLAAGLLIFGAVGYPLGFVIALSGGIGGIGLALGLLPFMLALLVAPFLD